MVLEVVKIYLDVIKVFEILMLLENNLVIYKDIYCDIKKCVDLGIGFMVDVI